MWPTWGEPAAEHRNRNVSILSQCSVPDDHFDLLGPIVSARNRIGHIIHEPIMDHTVRQANNNRGLGMLRVLANLLNKGTKELP